MAKQILPGLTTMRLSDWRQKLIEAEELNIETVALFATCVELDQRLELYKSLESSVIKSIPHVHLRDDIEDWEIEYLINKFGTEIFNVHATPAAKELINRNQKYKKIIFVENLSKINQEFVGFLSMCGGLCVDFSHWQAYGHEIDSGYEQMVNLVEKHKIGCCHVSAIKNFTFQKKDDISISMHFAEKISDYDYLKNYKQYLPNYISIESENNFHFQLELKKYLEKTIL